MIAVWCPRCGAELRVIARIERVEIGTQWVTAVFADDSADHQCPL